MDHEDLMRELPQVEKMPTQERLKLARKRRILQLEKWRQREREHLKRERNAGGRSSRRKKIVFEAGVMLLEAAARNDVDEVRRLLKKEVDADATNEDGLTALHQCCIDDSEEMMKLLIDHGANVNAEDSEKWTPLHAAATCGHLHLVKFLITHGANLLAVNADGNMPYDICEDDATLDFIESEMAKRGVTQGLIEETRGATELKMLNDLKKMRSSGIDLEFRDDQGATPLHISAANGYMKVALYLLEECHTATDPVDNDGWQPIHAAAVWGHLDVLELLVQNGANLNARTRNGETPWDICEDPEMRDRIVQLKNEQEREILKSRDHKLRRSQSTNTRTQSVRRHSIRDKAQTPRKEAREEARIRLQQAFNHPTDLDIPDGQMLRSSVQPDVVPLSELYDIGPIPSDEHGEQIALRSTLPHRGTMGELFVEDLPKTFVNEQELQAFNGYDEPDSRSEPSARVPSSTSSLPAIHLGGVLPPPPPPSVGPDGVNLNVHVTVTVNPGANGPQAGGDGPASPTGSMTGPGNNTGTLSDLKKQRAIARQHNYSTSSEGNINGGSPVLPSRNSHSSSLGVTSPLVANGSGTVIAPSPSSPRKFVGAPNEVIGSAPSPKACCVVM